MKSGMSERLIDSCYGGIKYLLRVSFYFFLDICNIGKI